MTLPTRAATTCLAEAALPRGGGGTTPTSLDSNDSAEVVPLEENVHVLESDMSEQPFVLLEAVRDEHVFERLALLSDLEVAVALAALHLVIVVDEEPVERGMLAEHFRSE